MLLWRQPDKTMGLSVGIVADERYLLHRTGHFHPEHPARLAAVFRMLKRSFPEIPRIIPRPATLEELERIHAPAYIEQVMLTSAQRFTSLAPDTPACADTCKTAWLAAGGCIKASDLLVSGKFDAVFALVRPPGHHATTDRASGFCIINNIAVTAAHLLHIHKMTRILVIDFDVHFGNGIASIFSDSPNVFYISSHDPLLFPYSGEIDEAGTGDGVGYTICIPFPREISESDLAGIYARLLPQISESYHPEVIIVAAGFDAHIDDPIGRCSFTENFFGELTAIVADIAWRDGKRIPLLFVLEGGYHPGALAGCVEIVLSTLADPPGRLKDRRLSPLAKELEHQVMTTHRSLGVIR